MPVLGNTIIWQSDIDIRQYLDPHNIDIGQYLLVYWVTPFRSRKTAILVLFFAVIAHFKGKCTHENRLPRDFWAFPSHCSFKQMNPSHSCLRCSEFHVGSFEMHQKRVFWGCCFTSQGAPNISRYIGPNILTSRCGIVLGGGAERCHRLFPILSRYFYINHGP